MTRRPGRAAHRAPGARTRRPAGRGHPDQWDQPQARGPSQPGGPDQPWGSGQPGGTRGPVTPRGRFDPRDQPDVRGRLEQAARVFEPDGARIRRLVDERLPPLPPRSSVSPRAPRRRPGRAAGAVAAAGIAMVVGAGILTMSTLDGSHPQVLSAVDAGVDRPTAPARAPGHTSPVPAPSSAGASTAPPAGGPATTPSALGITVTRLPAGARISLTPATGADWMLFGAAGGPARPVRDAAREHLLGGFAVSGAPLTSYQDPSVTFAWSSGTPAPAGSAYAGRVAVGPGGMLRVTGTAGPAAHTLVAYVGTVRGTGRVRVTAAGRSVSAGLPGTATGTVNATIVVTLPAAPAAYPFTVDLAGATASHPRNDDTGKKPAHGSRAESDRHPGPTDGRKQARSGPSGPDTGGSLVTLAAVVIR